MSGARPGARIEREIVDQHKALGVHCERYPLSGASRFSASAHDVDLHVFGRNELPVAAVVKARANGRWLWHTVTCPRPVAHMDPHPPRGPAMTMQLDLFAAPPDPPRHTNGPIDPLPGLSVQQSDTCQCGSYDAVIGERGGPHRASLFCRRCERQRGWMANEA